MLNNNFRSKSTKISKISLYTLFFWVVTTLMACKETSQSIDLVKYQSEKGLSLSHPSGWKITTSTIGDLREDQIKKERPLLDQLHFKMNDTNEDPAALGIVIYKNKNTQKQDSRLSQDHRVFLDFLFESDMLKVGRLSSSQSITRTDYTGLRSSFYFNKNIKGKYIYESFIKRNEKLEITVSLQIPQEKLKELEPYLDKILNSINY